MKPVEVFLLALALSADAFSVALAVGLRCAAPRQRFRLSWHFGLFQALMPFIGAAGGTFIRGWVPGIDRYVAFAVLAGLGAKMVCEGARRGHALDVAGDPTRGLALMGLSVATSLDALGVGVGLALLRARLVVSCLVIGITAGLATLAGMLLGARLGALAGRFAGIAGGILLIGVGVKMLTP
jgi:putative Mn2+ efflux pump MntP